MDSLRVFSPKAYLKSPKHQGDGSVLGLGTTRFIRDIGMHIGRIPLVVPIRETYLLGVAGLLTVAS